MGDSPVLLENGIITNTWQKCAKKCQRELRI